MQTNKNDEELLRNEFYFKGGVLYRTRNDQEILATPSARGYRHVRSQKLQATILYGRVVFLLTRGYLPRYVYYKDGDKTNCEPSNLTDKRSECLMLTA